MISILTNTYFSGAGLMDIGLQSGGLTLQQSFEIEALCCDISLSLFWGSQVEDFTGHATCT